MNCLGWEERIGAAARTGNADRAIEQHLERCPGCRRFAALVAVVTAELAEWDTRCLDDQASEAAHSALVERLAAIRPPSTPGPGQHSTLSIARQLAVVGLAGAAALAAGAVAAPGWVRIAFGVWLGLAGLSVSLVLLHHGQGAEVEGEQGC
jgi:hypothetical protein